MERNDFRLHGPCSVSRQFSSETYAGFVKDSAEPSAGKLSKLSNWCNKAASHRVASTKTRNASASE
jgi:hypothetical protein